MTLRKLPVLRRLPSVIWLLCMVLFGTSQLSAQPTPKERIEAWDATASKVEKTLQDGQAVASEQLEALRSDLIEQRSAALELRAKLQSSLEPLQNQLQALGPAPENGAATDPEVEARRKQLLEQISGLEARQKEVGLILSRAAALEEQLARRQRLQFTDLLVTRGVGPFDASAWGDLAKDAPKLATDVGAFLKRTFTAYDPLGAHVLITLAICLSGVVVILSWRSVFTLANRLSQAASRQTSPGRKALYTALEFLLRAGPVPLIAFFVVTVALNVASPGPTGAFILKRIAETAAILSALAVLSYLALRGDDAPTLFDDKAPAGNRWLVLGVFGLAIVFALDWLALDFLEQAGASLGTLAIANGLVATLAAASLTAIAVRIWKSSSAGSVNQQPMLTGLDEDVDSPYDFGLNSAARTTLRTLLISAALVLIVAAWAGYYAMSRYVLTGVTLTGLLVGAATVLYHAFTTTCEAGATDQGGETVGAAATPRNAKPLNTILGLVLAIAALPLLARIWGASSADISSTLLLLFSDINIGGAVISIQDLFWAVLVLILGIWATRLVQRFLRVAVLDGSGLASGARAAIYAGVGYFGILLTLLFAVSAAGIALTNLAIIAGALSVGIGFGLQNVVSNFVSGLILLIERPIQPGDWIEVGGFSGYVKRINVRSTEITTFDRASVIVPNSELISASVVNWTHRSLVGRATVKVGVGYESDPEQVTRILNEIALAHDMVLKNPAPWIIFMDFGASSLDFELRCYLRDINSKLSVESDLRFALLKRLREEGVEIPFPQRVVHMQAEAGESDAG